MSWRSNAVSRRHSTIPIRLKKPLSKLLHRFAQKVHLLLEIRAAVANGKVHAQPQALGETEPPIETLGHQVRNLLARGHHLPNQFCSRHRRSAIRARQSSTPQWVDVTPSSL